MNELKKVLDTSAGMWCVWNPGIGKGIISYEKWEEKLIENKNLIKLIQEKLFVPINLNTDGAFEFTVRINDSDISTQREKSCFVTSSNNYIIESNGLIYISGIEYIE
ncbi:MAG: hypothetical protein LBJ88_01315 [Campylobacteraceae bacterium]|nr:hypothetical protein [Campylobacteraceae bacterium]